MPPEMFSYADISGVTDLVKKATSSYNYESSVSVKWNIRSTPPKPDLKKLNAGQIARAMNQSQFMNRFLPVRVQEFNIGSNAGLSRYLKMLQDTICAPPLDSRYHVLMVDVNIFERCLKVQ